MVTTKAAAIGFLAGSFAAATPLRPRASGCGVEHHVGYNNDTSTHTITSGGYSRTYSVFVPPSYNDNTNKARALIIDYHGKGGNGYQQYTNSQYDKYSAGQEYVVVYPDGVDQAWQGPSYANKNVNDLQFTTDLVARIRFQYCIDDARIYASGKSNGGGFVDTLACSDNGDEFAAFGMAAAALYTDTSMASCSKKRAILEAHGDKDVTIPYHPTKDGSGGPLPDISMWTTWWGHRTCGSNAQSQRSGDLGGYNKTTYSCGSYNNVIDHYQIFKGGHCWPNAKGDNYDAQNNPSCTDRSLDYTPVVLDFFAKWNMGNAPS
ncbi:hypothetical protein DOTSEDRAFT_70379 [Dothistroma septosporum NZE10]|uniref:feruloyl esterase n=1 Tax=Dothistroma septosporum (strain NZE10 / CBS 128990) TaxID=675120 RepID=N1PTS9_DOTSN|nr:hypothetical protein DOTSEDRAFT_70379 [Dothistroma septosporum NZE10]